MINIQVLQLLLLYFGMVSIFMNQVVVNYAITNNIKIYKIESENLTKQKKLIEPKIPPGSDPRQ